jgi:aminoglycoside phosphotransferase (APT) family kinase protein
LEHPIAIPSQETTGASALLATVAEQLHRTLVGFSETVVEPTDDGYVHGYELELLDVDGQRERQLVFVFTAAGVPASAWLYPADPVLVGLRTVTDVVSVAAVLMALGVSIAPTGVDVVSYRPGRRAVVRVDSEGERMFLKVVDPAKAEFISERLDLFRSSGLPVPRLLGWSPDGVVAMSGVSGVEAQSVVARIGDHSAFLDQVDFLCALVAAVPSVNTARPSLFRRLDWYLERLAERLPGDRDRIDEVGAAIAVRGADGFDFAFTPVTIHGDLHLGQLFVDRATPSVIAGMLDIDTAGVGDPADDAGAFYAHVVALGESVADTDARAAAECFRLATGWQNRWQRNLNAGFAARASAIGATHLLGHALQPKSRDSDGVSRRLLERAAYLVQG